MLAAEPGMQEPRNTDITKDALSKVTGIEVFMGFSLDRIFSIDVRVNQMFLDKIPKVDRR
jgi:hypothetical protein